MCTVCIYINMIFANDFAAGCHLWKGVVPCSLRATLSKESLLLGCPEMGGWGSKTCEMTSDQWENDDVR